MIRGEERENETPMVLLCGFYERERRRDNLTCNNHAMETDGESDRLGVSKKMFKSVTVSLLFSS